MRHPPQKTDFCYGMVSALHLTLREEMELQPRVHEKKKKNRHPTFCFEPQTGRRGHNKTKFKKTEKKNVFVLILEKNPIPLLTVLFNPNMVASVAPFSFFFRLPLVQPAMA